MDLATRNAAETLAREQVRWLADQGKTLGALEELADGARPARPARCGSSATTSRPSRAPNTVGSMVVFEEGRPRTGEYRRFRDQDGPGPERLRQPPGGAAAPVPQRQVGRGGECRGAALGDAGPRHRRRRPGQVSAAKSVLDELGLHDLPLAGLAKEREELVLPDRAEPVLLPTTSPGALPGPAAPRRGASVRDHLPPRTCAPERRSARRSTTCPGVGPKRKRGAAQGRSDRSSASARRRSSRSPRVPGIGPALAARIKADSRPERPVGQRRPRACIIRRRCVGLPSS